MSNEIVVKLKVNGKDVEERIPGRTLLVDFLRERLHLTGTKIGCGMGECGACAVLLDGEPVNSCLIFAAQAHGKEVTTVEGLKKDPDAMRLREAFIREGAVQCGFCTPGFMISSTALLKENPSPDPDEIKTALSGNLCRCTGYKKIIDAVSEAAKTEKDRSPS